MTSLRPTNLARGQEPFILNPAMETAGLAEPATHPLGESLHISNQFFLCPFACFAAFHSRFCVHFHQRATRRPAQSEKFVYQLLRADVFNPPQLH
jgi:hypothetical protein